MISRDQKWWSRLLLAIGLMATAGSAAAQLLDYIEANSDQGVTEYRLQFSIPIFYIKHFPPEQGKRVKIFLQATGPGAAEQLDYVDYLSVPTPANAPPMKVGYTTVRDCFAATNPICLDIEFSKPVRYRIRPGKDGRSLLLTVLPGTEPADKPKKK
jgi:hypothetical protein